MSIDTETHPALDACFLGPYGENDSLLEKLVVEFLRDHVYWRRNFHPEDPPAIPTSAAHHPDYQAFEARLRRELHQLSAALKKSVPFHSPRYLGHMVSDLLIPGLAAQMLTLPYNPNNVSEDAAPVTVDLEVQVGLQLARMLGYPHDPARQDCAFGHLTSGGTLANYQALRLALALKAFPVALRAAKVPEIGVPDDDESAFNLAPAAAIGLLGRWQAWLALQAAPARRRWQAAVAAERLEQHGLARFFARHPQLRTPVVLAPVTAHYSWSKGVKLLGLGRGQLRLLPERGMRLDLAALEETLADCLRQRQPVLLAVAVLGTTEYGTVDPVDGVADARDRYAARGLGFSVHVDGAWGGYLASLFRQPDGGLRSLDAVREGFRAFPAAEVHAAFGAIARTDSVTVDPHKLGYLPYGSGAFVCRDNRAMALLTEEADYVFHAASADDYLTRFRSLGQFIPEGSKPGASAAAAYVTHKVLPLDYANFGRLQAQTILAAEAFQMRAERFAQDMQPRLRVLVPFAPDSNLVCLALNPAGNTDIGVANAFLRKLHGVLRCDPSQPLQLKEFFGSITSLRQDAVGEDGMHRILRALGLDPSTASDCAEDRLLILRHTLMNPYVIDRHNGISYIDLYFQFLARTVDHFLAKAEMPCVRPSPCEEGSREALG
ncbi:pyridoxal phosphate-dependent decarboxylase family protein [Pseudoxanthomonas wuyuanensis]|uniref:Glutamate or tyrosine decarboxylase n=1 Tax=Pseudoxanthomonas wuyuanensis TaxID=1073196 RepID=A0A286D8Q4_9GAMM|nr:pyridoxal-dependent decarboxylase [Pseudoxanthomonas wuyuanensis]KAF1720307.1 pyridoxal-dependent decarboxylase [Pseudoxanthomonas wuyuanensis]SOD55013.1 Glutamate or tyrosine decarboxylase [Pseudoxanthomonas wuyuanensis]